MLRRVLIVMLVLIMLAGCAALPPAAGGITVVEPYARAAALQGGNTGAFMTIKNGGAATDRLLSAAWSGAQAVELHETVEENGVMKMRPHAEGWEAPAGGEIVLKPGGKHIMLIGLAAPLQAGTEIEITLTFEKAGALVVKMPVRQP